MLVSNSPAKRRLNSSFAAPRLLAALFLVTLVGRAPAQQTAQSSAPPAFDVRAHYTKFEYKIPMRDGVRLFTSVYVPNDASQSFPILMDRTPYSVAPYGPDSYRSSVGPSRKFAESGYIFVYQDVRGRYMSEGKFLEMRPHIDHKAGPTDVDDSSDCYDTIEWLLKNVPNNNGKVGIWGISYPGFYTSASIIDSHPALKAASPQAPMTDLFMGDDGYHGGAFMLDANFGFYHFFKDFSAPGTSEKGVKIVDYKTRDAYEFHLRAGTIADETANFFQPDDWLWQDQARHTTYDAYWKARDLSAHMSNIKCAVMTVGGWFDAEDLSGPFKTYHSIETKNPDTVNTLVVGPWTHGGWSRGDGDHLGSVQFGAKTSEFFRDEIQFPFFEQYLKGKGDAKLPEAYVFETGSNVWKRYDEWPPKVAQPKSLYLRAAGKLSFDPPTERGRSFDEYVSDPNKPVPFVGYYALGVPQEYMVSDQRFAARRPDVLVYQTEPLQSDVTIVGPVSPHLLVSTTGTDSDFDVKLIDAYPDGFPNPTPNPMGSEMSGYQQLIRGEPMRGKFRKSFERPEPFQPGRAASVNFEMPDINHTFLKGHRIMIQIQSSWFPLSDRNPQKFLDIAAAKLSDFQKAVERVYRGKDAASCVQVRILP